MTDYIPAKDSSFNNWIVNYTHRVQQNCQGQNPVWTHIPAADVLKLVNLRGAWSDAYEDTLVPHTPPITEAKNEARKAVQSYARVFTNKYLRNDPVTNQQRLECGVPIRQPPSPVPPPKDVPELTADTSVSHRVSIHYRVLGSTKRGKPPKVAGIEIRSGVRDTPPVTIEDDLIHSHYDTKSPLVLHFDEDSRGKRLYLAGRWEIQREGIKGDFGPVIDVIIP
ncbi:MAG: hypothetical protein LBS37_07620 [Treponema sp.]|jgi:hypothetical protein|nr:hypothetical protein [Treponema sp.]